MIDLFQIGADGRRSQIYLAMSTAADFRDHLSTFSDYYASLGPPNPENLPEDGKLKSEMITKDNRRYYLDLKENSRGRFLRVSQTIARGGPRAQIAIPAQGMIEFRDALTDLLEEFGTDDGGFKGELPEGRHMRVENKNFYFDIGQNNRGIYMRVSEVKTNYRTAITIPEKSWSKFRDIFSEYCDKMSEEMAQQQQRTAGSESMQMVIMLIMSTFEYYAPLFSTVKGEKNDNDKVNSLLQIRSKLTEEEAIKIIFDEETWVSSGVADTFFGHNVITQPSAEVESERTYASNQPAANISTKPTDSCDTVRNDNYTPSVSSVARKTKVKKARLWKLSRDNPIGSSVPPFSGEHSVFLNLNEEVDAVDYLEALTTSDILEMTVCELVPGTRSDLLEFKASVAVLLLNKGMVRMRTSPGRPGRLALSKRIVTQLVSKEVSLDRMSGH
ncbi:hypothetical protein QYM36_001649 [Artemia franciscana]|uniref:Pur-alpha n=1 Tax=Artemia franciscana TaxID=6661 RepID=A0AA88IEL7_ARTSF|nr:hypothetical protein QYM36_001649 [Artemia franciscana]